LALTLVCRCLGRRPSIGKQKARDSNSGGDQPGRDYVQLIFEDPGYRDSLCFFIDQSVVGAEEAHFSGLVLRFNQGTLELNPSAEELVGPEIAMKSARVLIALPLWG
jgi:hypothetical protein